MALFPNDTDIYSDPIPFECDSSFDSTVEILKYIGQALFLIPGGILNFLVCWTISVTQKKVYKTNSFFILYTVDCAMSFYIIVSDFFFTRFLMYTPPLCDIIGPIFWYPSIILKLIYISGHYCRAAKSVIQILLVLNRMSCIIFPTNYARMWKWNIKIAMISIFVLPFVVIWNVIISRVFATSVFGGITLAYSKRVPWASVSMFQLFFITTALIFTIICTSITLYGLIMLPTRIKSAEKSLCTASILISIGFLSAAVFQFLFAFCKTCYASSLMLGLQFLSFDFLNIGSPIVMIYVSPQLRSHVLRVQLQKVSTSTFVRVSTSSVSNNF